MEFYYQLNYRLASSLPGFLRVYDYRYLDAEGTPRFPANISAWHKSYGGRPDVKIQINSQGFRGREPLAEPSTRIAMLGDSMVLNGAIEEQDSFPFLIEASLRQTTGDPKIEVLNFGVGDTNARQYFLKLKNHALAHHPDLVVVFIYLNDAIETPLTSFDTSARPITVPWYHSFAAEKLVKIYTNLKVLYRARASGRFDWTETFLSRKYLRDDLLWKKMIEDARFDWGAGWNQGNWESIESSMSAMLEIANAHHIELWMVLLPVKPQLELPDSAFELTLPQELGAQVAEHLKVKFLDPLPVLRSLRDADNLMYDQCHFTALGNKAIETYLAPQLEAWVQEKRSMP